MKSSKLHAHGDEQTRMAFSIAELSLRTGVSSRKLWQELHEGRLAHVRIGRRVLVTKGQAEEYLRTYTVSASSADRKAFEILNGSPTSARKKHSTNKRKER